MLAQQGLISPLLLGEKAGEASPLVGVTVGAGGLSPPPEGIPRPPSLKNLAFR